MNPATEEFRLYPTLTQVTLPERYTHRDSRIELDEDASSVATDEPDPVNLAEHTAINAGKVSLRFPPSEYRVDREMKLVLRSTDDVLHASAVDKYYCVIPPLYRSNCAVRDIHFNELMDFLSQFESLHSREAYTRKLGTCLGHYRRLFRADVHIEAELSGRLRDLMTSIKGLVDRSEIILSDPEQLSAAAGILCWPGPDGFVDPLAGFMGSADRVFYRLEDGTKTPFCATELKFIRQESIARLRWFQPGGALLAQTLQSAVGHGTPMALALTNKGMKVFIFERDPKVDENNKTKLKIFAWPPGPDFFKPTSSQVDEGLKVIVEIVHICTAHYELIPDSPPESERVIPDPDTAEKLRTGTYSDAVQNISKSRKSRSLNREEASSKKKRHQTDDIDETFVVSDGEGGMFDVTRISLKTRFSAEQLTAFEREQEEE